MARQQKQLSFALSRSKPLKNRLPKVVRRPPPDDDEAARQRLERRLGQHIGDGRLALAVTDNRHTMISVKREKGLLYRVRLHHMFLDLEGRSVASLARYIVDNDPEASAVLGDFIDRNQNKIRRARRRKPAAVTLETRGEIHDLQEVFDALNLQYFQGTIDARITWGRRSTRRHRRNSIKMGSYSVEDRLIRIHPSLDRKFIPRFFLEWIVYHEMLHQVHDIPLIDGRRIFHTTAFLEQEREFEHFEKARRWEREYLDKILYY